MRKTLLLLLAIGMIAVFAVGCSGTGITSALGAGAPRGEPQSKGNDDLIIEDDGSDVVFDADDIVLPGFTAPMAFEGINIKMDRFYRWDAHSDENYMIAENELFAFRTDENTVIILEDGEDFSDGDLEGRNIIVIYNVSTRSIPEMTTAKILIVLFEGIMPLI